MVNSLVFQLILYFAMTVIAVLILNAVLTAPQVDASEQLIEGVKYKVLIEESIGTADRLR